MGGIPGADGIQGFAIVTAAAGSGLLTLLVCPLTIRLAERVGFVDEPRGWKTHASATPHLGGAAVMAGLLPAVAVFGPGGGSAAVLLIGALAFFVVGSLDDRLNLDYRVRITLVGGAGAILGTTGYGWEVFSSDVLNVLLTMAWLLLVVNAVNLLDLMDGAAAGTAAACATGIAGCAAVWDQFGLAAAAAALAASCVAFLRFNLAMPSRLFLGDGGSMSIGFVLAASTMQLSAGGLEGAARLGVGAALLAVPLFDLTFRVYSRRRHGVSLLTAGPDSVANWLRERLDSPHQVAATLAIGQVAAAGVVLAATQIGTAYVIGSLALLGTIAVGMAVLLEASGFPGSPEQRDPAPSSSG